jgi:prepilin signal peptidase PulO-like enzyme (type II secretory pathway)
MRSILCKRRNRLSHLPPLIVMISSESVLEIFFWFLIGSCLGSFLNVLIIRANTGFEFQIKKIFFGRSKCPKCKKHISAIHNIPIISYLLLRGKCFSCHTRISVQYPLVELTTGVIWVGSFMLGWHNFILGHPLLTAIILTLMLGLFVSDLIYMTLPEFFSAPLFAVSLSYLLLENWGQWNQVIPIVLTALGTALFFFLIWFFTKGEGMGFGDVEYGLIMGMLLGFPHVIIGLTFSFISGALVGILFLLSRKYEIHSKIPFGPFLILGTIFGLIWGDILVYRYIGYF